MAATRLWQRAKRLWTIGGQARRPARRSATVVLRLEGLEDRWLPSASGLAGVVHTGSSAPALVSTSSAPSPGVTHPTPVLSSTAPSGHTSPASTPPSGSKPITGTLGANGEVGSAQALASNAKELHRDDGGDTGNGTSHGTSPDGSTWTQTTKTLPNGDSDTTTTIRTPDGSTVTTEIAQYGNGGTHTQIDGQNADGSQWSADIKNFTQGDFSSQTIYTNPDGSYTSTWTYRDGSTSTTEGGYNPDGSTWYRITDRDAQGNVTYTQSDGVPSPSSCPDCSPSSPSPSPTNDSPGPNGNSPVSSPSPSDGSGSKGTSSDGPRDSFDWLLKWGNEVSPGTSNSNSSTSSLDNTMIELYKQWAMNDALYGDHSGYHPYVPLVP